MVVLEEEEEEAVQQAAENIQCMFGSIMLRYYVQVMSHD